MTTLAFSVGIHADGSSPCVYRKKPRIARCPQEVLIAIKALILDWARKAVEFGLCAPMGPFVEAFQSSASPSRSLRRGVMSLPKHEHVVVLLRTPRRLGRKRSPPGRGADRGLIDHFDLFDRLRNDRIIP